MDKASLIRPAIIDSHCHLDADEFAADRAEVLAEARQCGVMALVIPSVTAQSWGRVMDLCRDETALFPALGLHPCFMGVHEDEDLSRLANIIESSSPVAIGEIGLDYYIDQPDIPRQQHFFEQQLCIAQQFGLPVIIHVRKAHDQVINTLRKNPVTGGIVHAFNGSLQQASYYIEHGFKLGFGGMLTYQRSRKLRQLVQALPLESLVLETDAPDMTGYSHHGQRNSPAYLPDCLKTMAEIRQESAQNIAMQTSLNTCQVLRLPMEWVSDE